MEIETNKDESSKTKLICRNGKPLELFTKEDIDSLKKAELTALVEKCTKCNA